MCLLAAVDLACFSNRAMGLFELVAEAMTEATSTQAEKLIIVEEEIVDNDFLNEIGAICGQAFYAGAITRSVDGSILRLSTSRRGLRVSWAEDLVEIRIFDPPNKFSTHSPVESKVGGWATYKTVIVEKQQTNLRPPSDEMDKRNHSSAESGQTAVTVSTLPSLMEGCGRNPNLLHQSAW